MPITKPSNNEFRKLLNNDLLILEAKILNTLIQIGRACIIAAKENGDYINRTGQLRRSIGFIVTKDGRIMAKSGGTIPPNIDTLGRGFKLIVYAGASYAEYVEAKGKDVIASSELMAEMLVPKLMNQLGFRLR
jgi:hypothetical protein